MIIPVELWLKYPVIDGIEISSFGRVHSTNGHYYKKWRNRDGYLYVSFRIDGKNVNKLVHRLVAQTFIPNPNNLPQVNHKDGNRANNNVSNLEFVTASYNRQYQEKFGVSSTESRGHRVLAVNLTTLEVSRFRSQHEASRVLGLNRPHINSVIKGKRRQSGGFWFTNDDNAADAIKRKLEEA